MYDANGKQVLSPSAIADDGIPRQRREGPRGE